MKTSESEKNALYKAAKWLVRHELASEEAAGEDNIDPRAVDSIKAVSQKVDQFAAMVDRVPEQVPPALLREIERCAPVESRNPWWSRVAIAASLVLTVCLGLLFWNSDTADSYYVTHNGEQRTIQLADGSSIMLNANTRLMVDFSDELRRLELVYGEAYFDVASDKARPFVVFTPSKGFKAVGTQFNIKYRSELLKIVVTEGVVQLVDGGQVVNNTVDASSDGTELIRANQSATVMGQQSLVDNLIHEQVGREISWREGFVVFDDTPLTEVVDEINNYIAGKIVLMDDKVGQIKGGGVYKIGREASFIQAMEQSLPIEVVEVTPYLTLLYHKS